MNRSDSGRVLLLVGLGVDGATAPLVWNAGLFWKAFDWNALAISHLKYYYYTLASATVTAVAAFRAATATSCLSSDAIQRTSGAIAAVCARSSPATHN